MLSCLVIFSACETKTDNFAVEATLKSSTLAGNQIIISTSKTAEMISFNEKTPEIFDFLGSSPYKVYSVTLFGLLNTEDFINSLTPIKADKTHWQTNESEELIDKYVDYFTLKIKLESNENSIKFSPKSSSERLDTLRIIDGYYYLNLPYIELNKEKTTFSTVQYAPDNYIYIETLDPMQKTITRLIVKITYDITFI